MKIINCWNYVFNWKTLYLTNLKFSCFFNHFWWKTRHFGCSTIGFWKTIINSNFTSAHILVAIHKSHDPPLWSSGGPFINSVILWFSTPSPAYMSCGGFWSKKLIWLMVICLIPSLFFPCCVLILSLREGVGTFWTLLFGPQDPLLWFQSLRF